MLFSYGSFQLTLLQAEPPSRGQDWGNSDDRCSKVESHFEENKKIWLAQKKAIPKNGPLLLLLGAAARTHTHLHALTHAESLTRTYTRALVCTQTHSLNPSKCDKKSNNKKIFLGKELSVGQTNIGRFIPLPNSLLLSLPPLSLSHSLSVSLTLSQSSQSSEGTEL